MTAAKPRTAHPSSRKGQTRANPAKLVVDESSKCPEGITVTLLAGDEDESSKANNHQKPRRRRNPAKAKKSRKKETANDVMLDAWRYAYERRNRRLA